MTEVAGPRNIIALLGLALIAALLLCGCSGETRAVAGAERVRAERYAELVTASLAQGRLSRGSSVVDMSPALPSVRHRAMEPSLDGIGFPRPPVADLAGLVEAAAEAEQRAREVQLLAHSAAGAMAAARGAQWPRIDQEATVSEDDRRLRLEIVSLRGEAAVLRALLDGVVYPVPEGTEERLAAVSRRLAEAAAAGGGAGVPAAGEGAPERSDGDAMRDGAITAAAVRHRNRVASAMMMVVPESRLNGRFHYAAALSELERRAQHIESELQEAARRVRE